MLCAINEVLLLNYKNDLIYLRQNNKQQCLERSGVSIVQLCLLTTMLPAALSPSLKLPHCFNTKLSLYKKMIRPQTYLTEITSPSDLVVSSHSVSFLERSRSPLSFVSTTNVIICLSREPEFRVVTRQSSQTASYLLLINGIPFPKSTFQDSGHVSGLLST